MDRLGPHDKSALQAASELGKHFVLDALHGLIETPEYGCDALIAADLVRPEGPEAQKALEHGETLLREPCVSHCHLHFYRDAIEVSLRAGAWDHVRRYAAALEGYVRAEPLPWAASHDRARGLAAIGSGKHSDALLAQMRGIRTEIERVGMISALPGLDLALAAA